MPRRPLETVALFLPTLAGGGAERATCDLAGALASQWEAVDLVVGTTRNSRLSPPSRVRLVDLSASRVLTAAPRLASYVRREKPLAVISAMMHANVIAIGAIRGVRARTRTVVVEHVHLSEAAMFGRAGRDKVVRALVPYVYPAAHAVVAVSEGVANDLAVVSRMPRDRIRVIPNAIPSDHIQALSRSGVVHPWLQAPETRPVIVSAGRLVPEKDFPTLLRAFVAVHESTDARLIVLGEGPERQVLLNLAARLGVADEVDFPGFFENPFPCIKRAQLFVLSSLVEGLPTVLLEALALGTPIVSTNCPSGPSEILEGGRLGSLVPPGDPAALARAILPHLDAAPSSRQSRLDRRYRPEAVAAQYLSICGVA